MTGPRRVLSRILLGVLGLLLVAVGAAVAAAGLSPSFAAAWTGRGTAAWNGIQARLVAAPAGALGISWWTLAALALLAVAIVLLLAWIFSRIGRQAKSIGTLESAGNADVPSGTTTVDAGLAAQAVRASLDGRPGIFSTAVSAWKSHGTEGLRITIQARKGAVPRAIADTAEEAVRGLDELLGNQVPVLIRIRSGMRSASAGTERVR
ncbi:hypothetical protein GCM10023081_29360 [Arthrobacter ginkgonis]|uniref:Alkaline shock response membrane anchor protein AmaP n=1 Tax=Arthrobacter ginkgonis TaxID=1630594 RepID=A0ABP7CK11_9MICC